MLRFGRCYCQCLIFVADLIAIICVLADVIAIYVEDGKPHFLCLYFWQMLLPWWQME